MLVQAYFYLNAALYAGLGLRGTLTPQGSAARLGYLSLSAIGRSEYLVAYGGLQIGLAAMFVILARGTGDPSLGLRVSIGFYAPVVLYRIATLPRHWPRPASSLGTVGVEAGLLVAAIALLLTSPAARGG